MKLRIILALLVVPACIILVAFRFPDRVPEPRPEHGVSVDAPGVNVDSGSSRIIRKWSVATSTPTPDLPRLHHTIAPEQMSKTPRPTNTPDLPRLHHTIAPEQMSKTPRP